jgi:outer membrane biogenesis lipoprotein LolB
LLQRDICLDVRHALRKALTSMKTPLLSATAVALLALTACQSKTETTTVANSTTENTTTAVTTPIELPPAIKTEGSYRCHGDNSLVKVTFFEAKKDGTMSVAVASPPEATPVTLSGAADKPMTADGGWALSGNDKSFKLTQPGKPEQSCSK